jgi:hypothetical protein
LFDLGNTLKNREIFVDERAKAAEWIPQADSIAAERQVFGVRHCDDYLFPPHYENRTTAVRVFARQFNALLKEIGLKMDTVLQTERTIYSLRHTAICMRIILSHGNVNICNPRQARRHERRADRTLLCPQLAAIARDGEEPAEFWGVKHSDRSGS